MKEKGGGLLCLLGRWIGGRDFDIVGTSSDVFKWMDGRCKGAHGPFEGDREGLKGPEKGDSQEVFLGRISHMAYRQGSRKACVRDRVYIFCVAHTVQGRGRRWVTRGMALKERVRVR